VELYIIIKLLKQETINMFYVIVKLNILLRYVKSRFYTTYSDVKCGTINRLNLLALALS
jgi:hypothetical protein